MIPIIDIFAGPGGLGEGFSSVLDENGESLFKIKLSIEKEENAHRTLRLRAFFRQFKRGDAPNEYYQVLRAERSIESLYELFPSHAAAAAAEAIRETLGPDSWPSVSERISSSLRGHDDWVLIGGPPCQAYSLVGRARNSNKKGYIPQEDAKHFLYQEYLRILANFWPAVFVMENVPGLLSSKPDPEKDLIFSQIISDLTSPAQSTSPRRGEGKAQHTYKLYSLSPHRNGHDPVGRDFVLLSEEHGVPQTRHRIIIVGIRDDFASQGPLPLPVIKPVSIAEVLYHLPHLRSGMTEKEKEDRDDLWIELFNQAIERRWFKHIEKHAPEGTQKVAASVIRSIKVPRARRGAEFLSCVPRIDYRPDWYLDPKLMGVCNHTSRAHIGKDIYRYFYAACFAKVCGHSPKLADFPTDLLPEHKNVADSIIQSNLFEDRFRVQPWDRPPGAQETGVRQPGDWQPQGGQPCLQALPEHASSELHTMP